MKKAKHSKEPWSVRLESAGQAQIDAADGYNLTAICYDEGFGARPTEDLANAFRIVECVNACVGIEEPRKAINEIFLYCKPHLDQKWAATIVAILLNCDFRDAKRSLDKMALTNVTK